MSSTERPVKFVDDSPVFVVGCGRSGTTLLQLMLNAHPNISLLGELHFFNQILQIEQLVPNLRTKENLDRFFGHLSRVGGFEFLPRAEERITRAREQLERADAPGYELFYRTLMEQEARRQGAARWGEKTPQNIGYLPELIALFPNARIIHIVRDPRDVVTSMRGLPWATDSIAMLALRWKIDMLYARQFMCRGGELLEVRYEDLVNKPQAVLERVCAYTGEPFDDRMLNFDETAPQQILNVPWKEANFKKVTNVSVGRWKQALSEAEAGLVEWITAPFLVQYGYVPAARGWQGSAKVPWVLVREAIIYLRSRRRELHRRRTESPDMIYGSDDRISRKLMEAVLTRH